MEHSEKSRLARLMLRHAVDVYGGHPPFAVEAAIPKFGTVYANAKDVLEYRGSGEPSDAELTMTIEGWCFRHSI